MTHNFCVADAYGDLIDDSVWRRDDPDSDASDDEPRKDDGMKIEKFRELIRSLQDDKPASLEDEEFEMEVTWEPGTDYVLLANVNSSSCLLYVIGRPSVCLSVVCNVGAPYSGD